MLTHLVLQLPPDRFDRLLHLITDPDGRLASGGYQSRKRKWRTRINAATRSIELNTDDVGWIQRQAINRNGGGRQKKVADIFVEQLPLFTCVPILPRKRPDQRRHRTGA